MPDGMHYQVTGLRSTLRALEAAGADAEDMKDLMHSIGETVASAARPRTPVGHGRHPGALRDSIRAGRGKTKAVVRAGSSRVPYAGVIHYGWPAHHIAPHPFLTEALQAEHREVFQELDEGLSQILREHHLS